MRSTRRAQPHRKGSPARQPGSALAAMLRGRTAGGQNPMDVKRAGQKAAPRFGAKPGLAGKLAGQRKRHKR